jgi:hypothetical protein
MYWHRQDHDDGSNQPAHRQKGEIQIIIVWCTHIVSSIKACHVRLGTVTMKVRTSARWTSASGRICLVMLGNNASTGGGRPTMGSRTSRSGTSTSRISLVLGTNCMILLEV